MTSKKARKLAVFFLILSFLFGNILTVLYWVGRCIMAIHEMAIEDVPFFTLYIHLLAFAVIYITPLFFSWHFAKKSETKWIRIVSRILLIAYTSVALVMLFAALVFWVLGIA